MPVEFPINLFSFTDCHVFVVRQWNENERVTETRLIWYTFSSAVSSMLLLSTIKILILQCCLTNIHTWVKDDGCTVNLATLTQNSQKSEKYYTVRREGVAVVALCCKISTVSMLLFV